MATRCASAAANVTSVDDRSSPVIQHDAVVSPVIAAVRQTAYQTPVRRASTTLPQVVVGGGGPSRRGRVDVDRDRLVVSRQDCHEDVYDGRPTTARLTTVAAART